MQDVIEYRVHLLDNLERQTADFQAVMAAVPEAESRTIQLASNLNLHRAFAHLRAVEALAFFPRLKRIVEQDRPQLEAYTFEDWTDAYYQVDETLAASLSAFVEQRQTAQVFLRSLATTDWARVGFHLPSGERTLQWWVEQLYNHAQKHLLEFRRAAQPQ